MSDKTEQGQLYKKIKEAHNELTNLNPQAATTALYLETKSFMTLNEAKADFYIFLKEKVSDEWMYHSDFEALLEKWFGKP